jgi:glucose-6-phosphate isomerase
VSFPTINPASTPAWHALQNHFSQLKTTALKELFAADAKRFDTFSLTFNDILFDYSKNLITAETLQ